LRSRLQYSLLVTAAKDRVLHLLMPTLILSMLAFLGCAFLIYAFFIWLRDELNPKRPVKRGNRRPQAPDLQPPNVIRYPHRRSL
jgi:hypothetical protein